MFKNKSLIQIFGLGAILLLSAFLNFYRLEEVPSGLYVDEASNGYNAYSLLETGKDEYGKPWPAAMRFLGSYSPPLYSYLTMLPVKLFGLEVWVVRFISAVSGVLGVLVAFWFLTTIAKVEGHSQNLPYIGALVMAVSPWQVLFARAGYEIYLGAWLFWLGVLLAWKGLRDVRFIGGGLVMLSLATYGAHTERYLVPVFILGFVVLCWRRVLVWFRKLTHPLQEGLIQYLLIFVAFLIQIPNFYLMTTPAWWSKNELFYWDAAVEMGNKYYSWAPGWLASISGLARKFGAQYLTYFSPRSLFWLGDPDSQRSMPELAVFYWWMIVPYIMGLYLLWKKRSKLWVKYVLLLLLVTPLPAALTNDPFSTQRALPMLMPLVITIALGINSSLKFNRKVVFCFVFLFCGSLVLLWRSYFVLLPFERAGAWNCCIRDLVYESKMRAGEHFVIDQSRQPPMYVGLAFFMKLKPQVLQASSDPAIRENYHHWLKFNGERSFANLELRSINWEEDIYKEQILIGDGLAISDEQAEEHVLEKIFEIKDPTGRVVFRGWKTNPGAKCLRSFAESRLCN